MVRTVRWTVLSISLLFAGLLNAVLAPPAQGSVCNGFIQTDYVSGPFGGAIVGDTVRVRLTLFSDGITNGPNNVFQVDRVRFELDCSIDAPIALPCTDDGNVILFQGNITSNQCNDAEGNPVTFLADTSSGNFSPNEVVFTPSAEVVIPSNTVTASGCQIEFDVQIASYSNDSTPDRVEEAGGYATENGVPDAHCDNGLTVAGSQPSGITLLAPTPTPTPSTTITATPADTPTPTPTSTFGGGSTPTDTPIPTPTSAGPGCASLRKTHSDLNAGDLHPGTLVRFRIVYNNVCRVPLLYLIDALPPGLSFVSANNGGVFSNGSVTWSGTILNRRSLTVSFVALIDSDVVPSTIIENDATLFDINGRTVTASDLIQSLPPAHKPPPPISLRASAPATSNAGRIISVIFTYKNMDNGGSLAITLSPNETLLSATPPPAMTSGNVLTWSGGALVLPNGSIKLRVQLAGAPGTVVSNTGSLSMVGGQSQTTTVGTVLQ